MLKNRDIYLYTTNFLLDLHIVIIRVGENQLFIHFKRGKLNERHGQNDYGSSRWN